MKKKLKFKIDFIFTVAIASFYHMDFIFPFDILEFQLWI